MAGMIPGITIHGITVRIGLIHTGTVLIGVSDGTGVGAVFIPAGMIHGITEVAIMVVTTEDTTDIIIIIIPVLTIVTRQDVPQRLITVAADEAARVTVRRAPIADAVHLPVFANRLRVHPVNRQLQAVVLL